MSGIKGKSGVYPRNQQHGEKISNAKVGYKHSEETKIKIGKSNSKPSKYTKEQKKRSLKQGEY